MAGKTDIQIIKEALFAHRLSFEDGIIPRILSHYINVLKTEIDTKDMSIKPGAVELLDHLNASEKIRLGLLTGNIEQGARIKLSPFDLNRYFEFGAFGDDNENRNRLLPIAVKKFKKMTNIDVKYGDCIVIGDTPMDVQCSKPLGATSIAIATGPYGYDALLETGADFVLKDLSNAMELKLFNP